MKKRQLSRFWKVNTVRCKGIKFQILVIDDGIKDKTIELLKSHFEYYNQLIKMPQMARKEPP